jgi:hypothetical protein
MMLDSAPVAVLQAMVKLVIVAPPWKVGGRQQHKGC